MRTETQMLRQKRALEDRLHLRNITVYYANNDCSIVFVVTKYMTAQDVTALLAEEGFELNRVPEAGVYASRGYWCELKRTAPAEDGSLSTKENPLWMRMQRENYGK